MNATVEISLYPLKAEYEGTIIQFIKLLKKYPHFVVRTTAMSTYVVGELKEVMAAIADIIEEIALVDSAVVSVIKVIPRTLPVEEGFLAI